MIDVDYMSVAEDSVNKIKEGAFLTVKSGDKLNTMTSAGQPLELSGANRS